MNKNWIWPILIFGGIVMIAKKAASNVKAQVAARNEAITQAVDSGAVYTPEAQTLSAPAGNNLTMNNGGIL